MRSGLLTLSVVLGAALLVGPASAAYPATGGAASPRPGEVLWQPSGQGRAAGGDARLVRTRPAAPAPSPWRVEPAVTTTLPAGTLLAVSCATRTSCVAVGYAASRGGSQVALIERLRGGRWRIDLAPVPEDATDAQLTGVSCSSAASCFAVGYDYDTRGDIHTLGERWNGRAWSVTPTPDPPGAAGAGLFAVSCTSATACTAAGDYNDRSGTSLTLVERWNGSAWSIEPTPNPAGAVAGGLFGVSCPSASACTAVGSFVDAAGTIEPLAEALGPGGWSLQAAANPPGAAGSGLTAIACSSASACIAVGQIVLSDGTRRTLAETWDGTSWGVTATAEPAGATTSWLAGVSCSRAGRCTAVGQYDDLQRGHGLAESWNGSAWSEQAVVDPAHSVGSGLSGVSCSAPGRCAAIGGYLRWQSTIGLTLAYSWNDAGWKVAATQNPTGAGTAVLLGVSCPSTDRCVAVGYHENRAGVSKTFAEASAGGRWRRQRIPSPSHAITTQLEDVACPSVSACIAVGNLSLVVETQSALVERWDGRRWSIETSVPLPATTYADLTSVSCASADDCTAVGGYTASSGNGLPLAEHWNGVSWARERMPLPAGARNARLFGVACPAPAVCVAVGDYGTAAGEHPLAERWNGTAWAPQHPKDVPHAFAAGFSAVSCSSAAACTAVGSDVNAQDRMVPLAERWQPGSWQLQRIPTPAGASRVELSGVSCGSAQTCVAVGYEVQSGPTLTLVETWNGRRWAATPTPVPAGTIISLLYRVSCPSAQACTAVGYRFGRLQIETALAIGRG